MTSSRLLTDSMLDYGDQAKDANTADGLLIQSTNTAAETVTERSAAATAGPPPMLANVENCTLCTRHALRGGLPVGKRGMSLGDPLAELIFSIHENTNESSLEQDDIDHLVKKAQDRVTAFREDLRNRTPELRQMMKINEKSMALFDLEEIQMGAILGRGGFSNVFEITGFSGKQDTHAFTPRQEAARKFVTDHAQKKQLLDEKNNNKATDVAAADGEKRDHFRSSTKRQKAITMARYALKHLRPTVKKDRKKFLSAAVDLVLEAQFLLTMEHPHIIKIRGFAQQGPEGFQSGKHNGYFIIVDQLPEILEERMWSWRQIHRSCARPGIFARLCCGGGGGSSAASSNTPGMEMSLTDLRYNQLMEDRLRVAFEITSALEYIHKRGIIYRDIKPTNIGFDIRGDVKIFDFGLARFIPNSASGNASSSPLNESITITNKSGLDPALEDLADDPATTVLSPDSGEFETQNKEAHEAVFLMSSVGTPYYMAPEVRLRQPYNNKADVFSMGVVLWEMLTLSNPEVHQVPRKQNDDPKTKPPLPQPGVEIISNSSRYRDFQLFPLCSCWPAAIQELVSLALSEDYRQRPTAEEMKNILGGQIGIVAAEMDESSARRRSTYLLTDIPLSGHSWANSSSSRAGASSFFRSGDSFNVSKPFSSTGSFNSTSGGSGPGPGPRGRRSSYSRSSFTRNSFTQSSSGPGSSGSIGNQANRKSFSSRFIMEQGGLTAPLIEELSNDLENSLDDFASAEQSQQQHAEGMARTSASNKSPIQEDKDDVGPME